jgi:hypothetical protein
MKLKDREGNELPIMGHPMGPVTFNGNADFLAKHPRTGEIGILFGIDPTAAIELTVVNFFGKTVVHTFQPGANSYLIKAIKYQDLGATVVNYYI